MISTNRRPAPPISLDTDEAAVLSFVARHAHSPIARPSLQKILSTSSDTAQAIGAAILDSSAVTEDKYRVMADRFVNARKSNLKYLRILKSTRPK